MVCCPLLSHGPPPRSRGIRFPMAHFCTSCSMHLYCVRDRRTPLVLHHIYEDKGRSVRVPCVEEKHHGTYSPTCCLVFFSLLIRKPFCSSGHAFQTFSFFPFALRHTPGGVQVQAYVHCFLQTPAPHFVWWVPRTICGYRVHTQDSELGFFFRDTKLRVDRHV